MVSSKRVCISSSPSSCSLSSSKIGFAKDFKVLKNPKFEIYTDKSGEFRFRLKATNGQIIAVGEGYKSKKSVDNGIASVKKNVVDAKIVEE